MAFCNQSVLEQCKCGFLLALNHYEVLLSKCIGWFLLSYLCLVMNNNASLLGVMHNVFLH